MDKDAQLMELSKSGDGGNREVAETEEPQEEPIIPGMLPSSIVDLLAAREKYAIFISFLGLLVH